ncbi:MAG: tetratricopeptide repeat protein [Verrucomicrobiota bacterium]|nr:tetratricopeptide repeat protein [Verrucomicrobiota bacterium]
MADALSAIDEGLPQIALQKLNDIAKAMSDTAGDSAFLMALARAQFALGQPKEAIATIDKIPAPQSTAVALLKAQSFAALSRWEEARALFSDTAHQTEDPLAAAASLGEAESLLSLGRPREAIKVLEAVAARDTGPVIAKLHLADLYLDLSQVKNCEAILARTTGQTALELKWRTLIEARLLLAKGHPAPALERLNGIIKSADGCSESLLVSATLALAEARTALNGLESANDVLEDYLWQHPDSRYLDLLFRKLDQIYASEENPSESQLQKMADAKSGNRTSLALFYLGIAQARGQRQDRALRTFALFAQKFPQHALAAKALLLRANLLRDRGKYSEAFPAYEAAMRRAENDETRGAIELEAGIAYLESREFVLAAGLFQNASRHAPALSETAIFDAALAWLGQGNYDRFRAACDQLDAQFPGGSLRSGLTLEEGLAQARTGDKRAMATIENFVRDFPHDARAFQARLVLAELSFGVGSDAAPQYLRAANEAAADATDSARAEYLAIFESDAAQKHDDEKTIQACLNFIRQRPDSELLPDVRMKLGQIYFRRSDYANAQTQLELLADQNPDSPLIQSALFIAAQAAQRSMNPAGFDHALELFERVAKLEGPLKWHARLEQAALQSRMGNEKEAIIVYNAILKAAPEPELRFAALGGKADAFFSLGGKDPASLRTAIGVYDELAMQPEVTATWRNQALYKKAKSLEKLEENDAALATFDAVLQIQPNADTESFWRDKAGFDASRILESQQQWQSAIAIYRKISAVDGPRAAEAKKRVTQLRLEHFIWEE